MRLILPIYSCLLGLLVAVHAHPVKPSPKQKRFDLDSELKKWVEQPVVKEKIGKAWKLKGGWEGWAQVEIAIFFQDTLGEDFEVTREDAVYEPEGTQQLKSDITVHQKSTKEVTILELKCESLNNRKKFGSGVGKDILKIQKKIKSAYNTETSKSTIWSVAIGGIEGTGKGLGATMGKPIEFETTDNRKMGIWRAKVVVKDKKGTSTGSAPNKAATGAAEPSQSPKQAQPIEHHDAAPAGKNNDHDKDATAESWQKALTTEHPAKEHKGAAQPTSRPQTPPSDQKEPPNTPPGAPVKPAAERPKNDATQEPHPKTPKSPQRPASPGAHTPSSPSHGAKGPHSRRRAFALTQAL